MRKLKFIFGLVVVCSLISCTTIMSQTQNDIIVKKGRTVSAYDDKYGFLNITVPNLSVAEKLVKECPRGVTSGTQTRLTKQDFLLIQMYSLEAKASCQDEAISK